MPSFPSRLFHSYDIRGLVSDISTDFAYTLGRAFCLWLKEQGEERGRKKIVVGYDMRPTSKPFADQVIRGINESGWDVVSIGLTSTPLFNFACADVPDHVGGIMVTASHNPAAYNGFKLTFGNGMPIGGESGLFRIQEIMESAESVDPPSSQLKGVVAEHDPFPAYEARLFSLISKQAISSKKLVIDAGNGMAQVTTPRILGMLSVVPEYLYLEPDGRFPNHEANPLKIETLQDLQARVKETGADFGFAFDGDADRLGLVDETGAVVPASLVGTIIGLEILRDHPGAKMAYDLRQSMIVPEAWKEHGASSVVMTKVGHANIKHQMQKEGIVFASELSLHLYFESMYFLECPDLALLHLLRLLSREQKPLSEIIKPFERYAHSGEINFTVSDAPALMERLEERYRDEAMEILHLDGLSMRFSWGWFNVRASNTEPVVRLNLEARTSQEMKQKVTEIHQYFFDSYGTTRT